jgi:SAM-dependent methyltransferase
MNPPDKGRSYREVNAEGWNWLSANNCHSSRQYGDEEFARAKEILDPYHWLNWSSIGSVLCLACGGGQQGPLFASLGIEVTSLDISKDQLEKDRVTAEVRGFHLECVLCDMLDLSTLSGKKFDLVYQAVSACYVPSVESLYEEIAKVVNLGGEYWVEHQNPLHHQLEGLGTWNGRGYEIRHPQITSAKYEWVSSDDDAKSDATVWHFIHSMTNLIGSLCNAGFSIERFAERPSGDHRATPGTQEHLASYVPPFFAMLARKHSRSRRVRPPSSAHE